jgi:hypothetical protein
MGNAERFAGSGRWRQHVEEFEVFEYSVRNRTVRRVSIYGAGASMLLGCRSVNPAAKKLAIRCQTLISFNPVFPS